MESWLTVLPPVAAILLAIISRQVVPSLFVGIWMGWTVLAGGDPLAGLVDALQALVDVFKSSYNTHVVMFSLLVGSLITLTQRAGGVDGFVRWMRSMQLGQTRRGAGLVAVGAGFAVFVESSITCLVVGAVARPLCDRARVSREKLAYLCDSTSAPVCVLVPLNAWGAYVMGLLAEQGIERPLAVMLSALPLNFYALSALGIALVVVLSGRDLGPMRRAERRAREEGKLVADGAVPMISSEVTAIEPKEGVPPRLVNMVLPLAVMVLMMPVGLFVTGRRAAAAQGDLSPSLFDVLGQGSGATAVFWAVLAAIGAAAVLYRAQRIFSLRDLLDLSFKGAGGLIPMAVIMTLAFALNATCTQLGTGPWVAAMVEPLLLPGLVPVVLFLTAGFIAFSTGTSWGTFGIMMPLGISLTLSAGASLPLAVAAILGGGVFGDHCSPISDTTVISSMATACDHVDHVKTQLPYALLAAAIAGLGFLVAGLLG